VALAPHTAANGYTATRRLLSSGAPLTALMCTTDLMAMGALCALDEAGLKVPRDISVIGWDDIPLAAYATPPLTTVRQPIAELARRAVAHLLNLIDGSNAEATEDSDRAEVLHSKLPPELVVRQTTGPRPRHPVMAVPSGMLPAHFGDGSRSPPVRPATAANDHQ
jgi:DNA-binding LacI/PurR family transcriptional regulator